MILCLKGEGKIVLQESTELGEIESDSDRFGEMS